MKPRRGAIGAAAKLAALLLVSAIELLPSARATAAGPDYPGATYFPVACPVSDAKCAAGRGGAAIRYIIIDDSEGGWDATVASEQLDAGKGLHYLVGRDGKVAQFVLEADTAYQSGNGFYNTRAVSVALEGFASGTYTRAELDAAAALVRYLRQKYTILASRDFILGEDQIPNGSELAEDAAPCPDSPTACEGNAKYGGAANHRSPGASFEWCPFLAAVGGTCKCTDATPLLRCTADGTHAARCVANVVELDACGGPQGCRASGGAAADTCDQASSIPDASADGATSDGSPVGDAASEAPTPSDGAADRDAAPASDADVADATGADRASTDAAPDAHDAGADVAHAPAAHGGSGCGCALAASPPAPAPIALFFFGSLVALAWTRRRRH